MDSSINNKTSEVAQLMTENKRHVDKLIGEKHQSSVIPSTSSICYSCGAELNGNGIKTKGGNFICPSCKVLQQS